jgi:hypothetical protein
MTSMWLQSVVVSADGPLSLLVLELLARGGVPPQATSTSVKSPLVKLPPVGLLTVVLVLPLVVPRPGRSISVKPPLVKLLPAPPPLAVVVFPALMSVLVTSPLLILLLLAGGAAAVLLRLAQRTSEVAAIATGIGTTVVASTPGTRMCASMASLSVPHSTWPGVSQLLWLETDDARYVEPTRPGTKDTVARVLQ